MPRDTKYACSSEGMFEDELLRTQRALEAVPGQSRVRNLLPLYGQTSQGGGTLQLQPAH